MTDHDDILERPEPYPVSVHIQPALQDRNRLTTFFRFFLAIPHILIVGGPTALAMTGGFSGGGESHMSWGSGGLLSAVLFLTSIIAWFAILFTGRFPNDLWRLAAFYMRWRVRAVAYLMLLRDEYPPFGDGPYPTDVVLPKPEGDRDRLTVAFRVILVIPHIIAICLLSVVWAFTTTIAWLMILFTGRYPETLYGFALGMLAWTMRVEAYLLLLRDEYPPFTLRA